MADDKRDIYIDVGMRLMLVELLGVSIAILATAESKGRAYCERHETEAEPGNGG